VINTFEEVGYGVEQCQPSLHLAFSKKKEKLMKRAPSVSGRRSFINCFESFFTRTKNHQDLFRE
jgi:hypothetical protein